MINYGTEGIDEDNSKTSKYNSGIAQILRLSDLWEKCHKYKLKGDYKNWKTTLDSIWSELARDLIPDTPRYKKYNLLHAKFILDCYNHKSNLNFLYHIMLNGEIDLGRLQNELGKGTALKDADEDMIE